MARRLLSHETWTAASGSPRARRLAPFAAVGIVCVLVAAVAFDIDGAGLWIAVALGAAAGAMVLWLPWERLPAWGGAVPALLFVAAVVSLRDAAGGSAVGVSALVLLPVLWLGLYGNRRQLAIVVPGIALAFFLPIVLIGEPKYPADQWAAGVIFVALALLIGPNVQRLIRRVKAQAADARRSQREIARVAAVARRLSTGDGTRRDVCVAACEIGDSAFAILWEPNESRRLVATAVAGVAQPRLELDLETDRSGAVLAFRSAAPVFVADAQSDPRVSQRLLSLVRTQGSILFQPVLRRGVPAGVLVVGWRERVDHEADRLRMMVGLLAAEAGIAIERADLMTQLEEMADTDELTGLPNRRGWNRELGVALRTPGAARPRCASRSSTWTSSRRSTTSAATRPATGCSSPLPPPGARPCARRTSSRGPAATSSRCCCRTATSTAPAWCWTACARHARPAAPARSASRSGTPASPPSSWWPARTRRSTVRRTAGATA